MSRSDRTEEARTAICVFMRGNPRESPKTARTARTGSQNLGSEGTELEI